VVSIIDLGRLRIKELENEVKRFWEEKEIPKKWREWVEGRSLFSFLEGPPTANGYPHVGHLRGRIYKDAVLKFHRVKGFNVWAQGGWDEQGLPVEVEVEKKLGIKHKKEIGSKVTYEEFVKKCSELVDYYLNFWEKYATKEIGLWLDLENAYETRRAYYIDHVWRFIKEAYERGLLYEGYRVLPYCPRCETALSDAEVDQGYQEKVSPSIYVKFKVVGEDNTYLIIWTTTPWTIIDNEAVAVNAEGEYCKIAVGGEFWWVAESRMEEVLRNAQIEKWRCVEKVKGEKLKGLKYVHPLLDEVPIHKEHGNAHYVITADFVSLEEGTGLVHTAPGHGPEDYEAGLQHGLPITSNVEINGVFNEKGGIFAGLYVEEASKKVISVLKEKGLLVYSGTITHKYPHCWRCHTPLIYRAGRQWFLKITAVKEDLLRELKKVRIYPNKLRARFDTWVENARDWTISRSRVWGTPLPIWKCKDNGELLVIGSTEELRKLAVNVPEGLSDEELVHRPWIDRIKIRHGECSEWVREPFVVDVWIDSGMAWLASVNGLKNRDFWRRLYPYTFVTEGIDQTRGWFYSLLATSVIMEGKAPYKEIMMQGLVLDKHGRKMSKHLGNVVWAKEALEKYGADQLRLYILSRYPPGETFIFNPDEIKESLGKLNIIWNVFRFSKTYMDLDHFTPEKYPLKEMIKHAKKEDLWILSRVNTVQKEIYRYMQNYELHHYTRTLIDFFIEDVSHNYLRLVRPRVWKEEGGDKYVVYSVLYYVLKKGLQLLAPITPRFAEALWQRFIRTYESGEAESIHLSKVSEPDESLVSKELEESFTLTFSIASHVASLRNEAGIKLRWPIRKVYIALLRPDNVPRVEENVEVLKFLTNSKDVVISTALAESCSSQEYVCGETQEFKACIPRELDRELYYEALAREIIRRVQVMRNKANLNVDEFIEVGLKTEDEELREAVSNHRNYIREEVRALTIGDDCSDTLLSQEWNIEGKKVWICIGKGGKN